MAWISRSLRCCAVVYSLLFLSSCGYVQFSAMKAHDAPARSYRKLLLIVETDMATRDTITTALQNAVAKVSITTLVPSTQFFLPGRKYTPAEMRAIVKNQDFDGILVITPEGSTSTTIPVWIGNTTSTAQTHTSGYVGKTHVSLNSDTTTSTPNYAAMPVSVYQFSVDLYDRKTLKHVWHGEGETDHVPTATQRVAQKMLEDGLLLSR